jgi:uncharacterized protein YdeI (YjbR/CyaY-like superfamily)
MWPANLVCNGDHTFGESDEELRACDRDGRPPAPKPGLPMKPKFFATPARFRAWLEAHHETETELLVGFHKKGTGKPSITWNEAVDEALCFGWIDGVRHSLGADAYTIRFTPRKRTSIWSAINVARVSELTRLGRMVPAGLRAFAARTPERTGVYSFERNAASKLTPAEEEKLRAQDEAAAFFDAQPPWYRRAAIHWVISAKREETRERRLDQLIAHSTARRTIPPLTRPAKKRPVAPRSKRNSRVRHDCRKRGDSRGRGKRA